MSEPTFDQAAAKLSREEMVSALFANLVVQHTNMAFMFLGRVPHPESGEIKLDLEAAKFFIDQLEMLEVKTKGNLDKREEGLLKQSLTALRMAFVESVEKSMKPGEAPTAEKAVKEGEPAAQPQVSAEAAADDESKKKFSKKY